MIIGTITPKQFIEGRVPINIGIVGSRSYEEWVNDPDFSCSLSVFIDNAINKYISSLDNKYVKIRIVSGGAIGIDKFAENYADEKGYEKEILLANWKAHKGSAGKIRNSKIINKIQYCIIFWDGESPGTKDMIDKCKVNNIPCKIIIDQKKGGTRGE
ncbi:MAG: SLOG family protein [Anaerovoracaceae bacterium]